MFSQSIAGQCHCCPGTRAKKQKLKSTYFTHDLQILSAMTGETVTEIGVAGHGENNRLHPWLISHIPFQEQVSMCQPLQFTPEPWFSYFLTQVTKLPKPCLLPYGPFPVTENGNWPHASHGQMSAKTSRVSLLKILYETCQTGRRECF